MLREASEAARETPPDVAERIRQFVRDGGKPKRKYQVVVSVPATEYITYEIEAEDAYEAEDNWDFGFNDISVGGGTSGTANFYDDNECDGNGAAPSMGLL